MWKKNNNVYFEPEYFEFNEYSVNLANSLELSSSQHTIFLMETRALAQSSSTYEIIGAIFRTVFFLLFSTNSLELMVRMIFNFYFSSQITNTIFTHRMSRGAVIAAMYSQYQSPELARTATTPQTIAGTI